MKIILFYLLMLWISFPLSSWAQFSFPSHAVEEEEEVSYKKLLANSFFYHWGEEGTGLLHSLFTGDDDHTKFRVLDQEMIQKIMGYDGPMRNGAILGPGIYVSDSMSSSAHYAHKERAGLIEFKFPKETLFLDSTYYEGLSALKTSDISLKKSDPQVPIASEIIKYNPGVGQDKYQEYFVIKGNSNLNIELRKFSIEPWQTTQQLWEVLQVFPDSLYRLHQEKLIQLLTDKMSAQLQEQFHPSQLMTQDRMDFVIGKKERLIEVLKTLIKKNEEELQRGPSNSRMFANLVFIIHQLMDIQSLYSEIKNPEFDKMLGTLLDWHGIKAGSIEERWEEWLAQALLLPQNGNTMTFSEFIAEITKGNRQYDEFISTVKPKLIRLVVKSLEDLGRHDQGAQLAQLLEEKDLSCVPLSDFGDPFRKPVRHKKASFHF